MDWDNITARNYKPLREAAGLPETTRFYDLRHTFATLMLEQGENPKVVQEILGHSQITHTMDTYSHVTPNMQREAFGSGNGSSSCLRAPVAYLILTLRLFLK